MATQTQIKQPNKGNEYIAEIADFMFATKSLEKIASGKGGWGDLVTVGVTAASFTILPAKLLGLTAKGLSTVIRASSKVVASDTASVAAKRAASKTLNDALDVKRGKGSYIVPDRTTPTEAAIAARTAREVEYSRPAAAQDVADAEYTSRFRPWAQRQDKKITDSKVNEEDYFNPDFNAGQEAEDLVNSSRTSYKEAPGKDVAKGSAEELKTKYVANPKRTSEQRSRADIDEAAKSEMYDKVKFTQDEIDQRISQLTKEENLMLKGKSKEEIEDYVRGGEYEKVVVPAKGRTTNEFTPIEIVLRKVRSGEYEDKDIAKHVDDLRKFNKTKNTPEIEDLIAKLEKEMPANIKPEAKIRYQDELNEFGAPTGKSKAVIDEPMPSDLEGPPAIGRGPMTVTKGDGVVVPRVSKDIFPDEKPIVRFAGSILAEIKKYENYNASITRRLRKANDPKIIKQLEDQAKSNKLFIKQFQDRLLTISKKLTDEERAIAEKIQKEITKRNVKYVSGQAKAEARIKEAIPGKGGSTAKLTVKGRILKAKAEVEDLRLQWKDTPASDIEARKELAMRAKKLADYIKKLEGN